MSYHFAPPLSTLLRTTRYATGSQSVRSGSPYFAPTWYRQNAPYPTQSPPYPRPLQGIGSYGGLGDGDGLSGLGSTLVVL